MTTTTADLEKFGEGLDAAGGADKAIAGKSPTRIALQRLRSDKVAMTSGITVLLLILLGLLAPVITSLLGLHYNTNHPDAPLPSEVLAFDGFPAFAGSLVVFARAETGRPAASTVTVA